MSILEKAFDVTRDSDLFDSGFVSIIDNQLTL